MKDTMRAGITASLLLVSAGAFAADAAYEQRESAMSAYTKDPSAATEGTDATQAGSSTEEEEASPAGSATGATSQGGASGEPGEATSAEERVHQAWVESIWSSP